MLVCLVAAARCLSLASAMFGPVSANPTFGQVILPADVDINTVHPRPPTILDSKFGYTQFRANDNRSTLIDARNASWIVDNTGPRRNLYPFLIDRSIPNLEVIGGTVRGVIPLDADWQEIYVNSAAVMVRDAVGVSVCSWTIRRAWDGIRIAGASDGFLIDNVFLSQIRDDAVENDHGAFGTISNSLFDGAFSGLSMSSTTLPDEQSKTVTLDNVLIRMQAYPFKGQLTHQSPFKVEAESPSLRIRDSVIAIEDVNHIGKSRLTSAWAKAIDASGNHLLFLSDDPLPDDYPLPGQGWTVLHGDPARNFWNQAKADWVAANRPAASRSCRPR
ncbi:MAG: hypothetical protein AAF088_17990 [Pseudomonadota bacterium]